MERTELERQEIERFEKEDETIKRIASIKFKNILNTFHESENAS